MPTWMIIVGVIAGCFALGAVLGAPYVPIFKRDADAAFDLAKLEKGQTLIDLGCGDGRILRMAAKRGAIAIGYEVNPLMWLWATLMCLRYGKRIRVRLANVWQVKLPPADVIYVFLLDRYMNRLDAKLARELTQPTTVVSYVFKLPRRPLRSNRNTAVYRYP